MAKYGVSVSYNNKRCIIGNHTDSFAQSSKARAISFADFINEARRLGFARFKKITGGKVFELHKGRSYNVIETKGNCVVIKKRVFAG